MKIITFLHLHVTLMHNSLIKATHNYWPKGTAVLLNGQDWNHCIVLNKLRTEINTKSTMIFFWKNDEIMTETFCLQNAQQ